MRRRWTACALAASAAALGCGGGAGAPAGGEDERSSSRPASSSARPPAGAEFGRHVVRVPGLAPADVAGAALLATFEPDRGSRPRGIVLTRDGAWRDLVLASQFAAAPVDAAIVPTEREYLPTASADLVQRLRPRGFPKAKGLQALILGEAGDDVVIDLQDAQLKLSQLDERPAATLAADLVPYRGGFAGRHSASVVVVSSQARDYALPAAAWSAFSGDTVAFVTRDEVPAATRRLLVQREKLRVEKPAIYAVGPRDVISDAVVRRLGEYGRVRRIAAPDPASASVALARYRERSTGFGWGLRRGPASVTLVNRRDWGNAAGAVALAARGPRAPLLLLDSGDRLPEAVRRYLRELAGPSTQAYALGDAKSIAPGLLREVDALLEAGVDA